MDAERGRHPWFHMAFCDRPTRMLSAFGRLGAGFNQREFPVVRLVDGFEK